MTIASEHAYKANKSDVMESSGSTCNASDSTGPMGVGWQSTGLMCGSNELLQVGVVISIQDFTGHRFKVVCQPIFLLL